ncbi:MAG TPA: hypothetical protein VG897_02635, partial [Terriglobales bacterium]|nr:hypothetical protein [Terriglobales bacterium]
PDERSLVSNDDRWESEWEATVFKAAMRRLSTRIDPLHFQAFDFLVVKGWPVQKVAKVLRINAARVYVIKFRVAKLLKQEIERLKKKPI